MTREPVWCHECGGYSFLDEWGKSAICDPPCEDICPICGEVWPAGGDGPIANPAMRWAAAEAHETDVWDVRF